MIVEYDVIKGYVGLHFSGLYLPLRVTADCYVSSHWIGFSWHSLTTQTKTTKTTKEECHSEFLFLSTDQRKEGE